MEQDSSVGAKTTNLWNGEKGKKGTGRKPFLDFDVAALKKMAVLGGIAAMW